MSDQFGFPQELLDQDEKVRLNYFHEKMINHPQLMTVHQEVMDCIHTGVDDLVIYVIGPTCVGKSTLGRGIVRELYKENSIEMMQDLGMLPANIFKVPNPDSGNFEWKDCYISALESMKEPMIEKKISERRIKDLVGNQITLPNHGLRRALINAYRYRQTKVSIWDEGQHITKVASGRRLRDQADNVKYIAEESRTVPILLGTSELYLLPKLSGQLGRRVHVIPFLPYPMKDLDDRGVFMELLHNVQLHIPHSNCINLADNYKFFYERSLGCFGLLHNWILRTLMLVYKSKSKKITLKDFEKGMDQPSVLVQISEEIKEVYKCITPPSNWRKMIQVNLSIPAELKPRKNKQSSKDDINTEKDDKQEEAVQKSGQKHKPGESKPRRDPVGRPD